MGRRECGTGATGWADSSTPGKIGASFSVDESRTLGTVYYTRQLFLHGWHRLVANAGSRDMFHFPYSCIFCVNFHSEKTKTLKRIICMSKDKPFLAAVLL